MREIEFRGKRADTKEWLFGDLQQNIGCVKIREQEKGNKIIAKSFVVNPNTIGQYTGLKDKNGTKIFEGDIVNIIYKNGDIQNCVVVFGDYDVFRDDWGYYCSSCGFALKFSDNSGYCRLTSKDTYEIIGNAHDNPELLGEV